MSATASVKTAPDEARPASRWRTLLLLVAAALAVGVEWRTSAVQSVTFGLSHKPTYEYGCTVTPHGTVVGGRFHPSPTAPRP